MPDPRNGTALEISNEQSDVPQRRETLPLSMQIGARQWCELFASRGRFVHGAKDVEVRFAAQSHLDVAALNECYVSSAASRHPADDPIQILLEIDAQRGRRRHRRCV